MLREDRTLRALATEGLALFSVAAAHGRVSAGRAGDVPPAAGDAATAEEVAELLMREVAEKQLEVRGIVETWVLCKGGPNDVIHFVCELMKILHLLCKLVCSSSYPQSQ